jgi:hypothetical protein
MLKRLYFIPPVEPRVAELFVDYQPGTPTVGECDLLVYGSVLWANNKTPDLLRDLSRAHRGSGKRIVVLIVHDFEKSYAFHPNLVLFRTSLRAGRQRSNEFVLPYVWECPGEPFPPLTGSDKPSVGFCGLATPSRAKVLKAFEKSEEVATNFIKRDKFWGGAPHDPRLVDEFQNNMRENQFIVCNRGAGNFSMRFYQTLGAGRIPVLVDTNIRLPFDDLIDWQASIVIGRSARDCLKRTIGVFRSGRVARMQEECAKIHKTFFAIPAAGTHLMECIDRGRQKKPFFGYSTRVER